MARNFSSDYRDALPNEDVAYIAQSEDTGELIRFPVGLTAAETTGIRASELTLFGHIPRNRPSGRPTMLMFGDSISGLSLRTPSSSASNLYALTATSVTAGSRSVTMNVSNASGLIAAGDDVAVFFDHAGYQITSVKSVSGTNNTVITLNDRLLSHCKVPTISNGSITKLVTSRPNVSLGTIQGPIMQAVAMMGGAVDMLPGYATPGGYAEQMIIDLPAWLRRYRPDHVIFNLFENSLSTSGIALGYTLATCKAAAIQAAKLCLAMGARPWFCTPVPMQDTRTGYAADWDAMLAFLLTLPALYPGVKVIDFSTPWLAGSSDSNYYAGRRYPAAGWTGDGTHMLSSKWATIAANIVVPAFSQVFSAITNITDYCLPTCRTNLTGTGGPVSNATGSVATVLFVEAASGWGTVGSKVSNDTAQRFVGGISTGANIQQTQITEYNGGSYLPLPPSAGGQWVKPVISITWNALTNMSTFQAMCKFSTGEQIFINMSEDGGGAFLRGTLSAAENIGKTIVYEGPSFAIPPGATYYYNLIDLYANSSGGAAAFDFTINSSGLIPAAPEITDITTL